MSLIYWPIVAGPVAANNAAITDPYFSSVVQLAHFDGTNGSTTFTNSCPRGNTMTSLNSTAISTATVKFGTGSLRIGAATRRAQGATNADYNFGTSDWTVEFWLNPDTLNRDFDSNKLYFDMRNSSLTAAWVPTINAPNALGAISLFLNGAARITSSNGVITAAAWNFIAACRNSGTTRLFVNGSQVGSDFADTNTYVQNPITIGASTSGTAACLGYFDDLRITNGVGRYSSNFSVPTSAFPNS